MNVQPSTRRRALYGVFRDLRLQPHAAFEESDLLRAWVRTGLRYSDLKVVLYELVLGRQLSLSTVGNRTVFCWTEASPPGSPATVRELFTDLCDRWTLRRTQRRRRDRHERLRSSRRQGDGRSG